MIPWRATYRLQLRPTFGFHEVERVLPYFARLGISHLYLSPILEARTGSTHGYDGTDPRRVRAELGGEDGFRSLAASAHALGLGILVDIVPNHLAVSAEGEPFADVLAHGESSPFAKWFDVDWEGSGSRRRVIVPWLTPGGKRNYRRYLDIDDLIGIRVDDPEVFTATHAKILELAHDGLVGGIRIDHLEGLSDPSGYLARLRRELPAGVRIFAESTSGEVHAGAGTTGYEMLGAITKAMIAGDWERCAESEYERLAGRFLAGPQIHAAVRRVLDHELAAEHAEIVERLRERFSSPGLDVPRALLWKCLDVEHSHADDPTFRSVVEHQRYARVLRYARAKGLEDTYLYRDVRMLARNELGIDPDPNRARRDTWVALEEVMRDRIAAAAESLTPTSTHDTKRSEDARSRCVVTMRHAAEFASLVRQACESFRADHGEVIPNEDAWFILQELIAIWPRTTLPEPLSSVGERLEGHVVKYAREAKLRSTWAVPDLAYEDRLRLFVRHCVDPRVEERFEPPQWRTALYRFAARVASESLGHSLAQVALKCLAPGIPDFYQGCEFVRPLLVDPDNRREVDFSPRLAALNALDREDRLPLAARVARAIEAGDPDRVKMLVTRELLRLRGARAEFLRRAAVAVHPFRVVRGEDGPAAIVVRRFDATSEICLVVPLVDPRRLADVRPLKLPESAAHSRTEWFTGRVLDGGAELSIAELVAPLGFALLVV